MKIEKILMLMIISCLLVFLISPATALEESEELTDGVDDVFTVDMFGYSEEEFSYISEHEDIDIDNLDIVKATYEREDKAVTLTLEVKGEIEDRGNIEDLEYASEDLSINTVGYGFDLITSSETYSILYANKVCQLTDSTTAESVNISESDWSVVDATLTVSFTLNDADETYDSLSVTSTFMKLDWSSIPTDTDEDDLDDLDLDELFANLMDIAPDLPLDVYAYGVNLATAGSEVEFIGSPYFGQPPLTYHWDFGDGSTSTEQSPIHIYDEPGVYEYTFTVTDNSGASESYTDEIEIVADEDDDTPGFELIIAITAIGLIFLWKRKR